VAFRGFYSGGHGIFTGSGGPTITIAKTGDAAPSGTFTFFNDPAISGSTVAFTGNYSSGSGIFTGSGGPLTTIAKTGDAAPSGTFTSFSAPAISGTTVAFRAVYGVDQGIFTGSGGLLETVIKNGDPLFGSTVDGLLLGRFGIDPSGSGNLAFFYALADGRSGIAIASAAVPEARAWLMLALVGAGTACAILVRRKYGSIPRCGQAKNSC
jgi:hypothetical protein